MNFVIVITSSPQQTQSANSAYFFTKAALAKGHNINQVFLLQDAVLLASNLSITASDENNIQQLWVELAQQFNFPLVACSKAALTRGIIDTEQAQQYQIAFPTLAKPFIISGLGQLIQAMDNSHRVMVFGS